jgi:hypothetical protein
VPVKIQVNVDGLPVFKSSNTQLWPILGRIQNENELFLSTAENKPLVIGVYQGKHKPTNVTEFLNDFVSEAQHLKQLVFNMKMLVYMHSKLQQLYVTCQPAPLSSV